MPAPRSTQSTAFAMQVGNRIEALRLARKIEIDEFCLRVGISRTMLYNYESGVSIPSAYMLGMIASVLLVSVESFYRCQVK